MDYNNLKRKIIVACQENTHGKNLVNLIELNGLTKIEEPHLPEFFNCFPECKYLNKIKGSEYIDSFREFLAKNSKEEGFVTNISSSFFNVARQRLGNYNKETAINSYIELYGKDAKFIYLNLKKPMYRAVLESKKREGSLNSNIEEIYKKFIKKTDDLWSKNPFEHRGQILYLYIEDLIFGDKLSWEELEDHIEINLANRSLGIDLDFFKQHYDSI